MTTLKELYHKFYYIAPLDQADSAESNRLFAFVWTRICFIFCFMFLVFDLFWYRNNLYEYRFDIGYMGVTCLYVFSSYLLSVFTKKVESEKAHLFKNIPLHIIFLFGVMGPIFLFYHNDRPYVNIIGVIAAVLVALSCFTISLPYFVVLFIAFISLIPGFINYFGPVGIVNLAFLILIFYLLGFVNRYRLKQHLELLKTQKKSLEVKTFGNFTPLYDKKVIKFSRSKSPELLAYLIYKNGSSVNTKELLSVLYGDFADSSRYGGSLRLLISDIKHSLSELGIQNFFIAEYNNFRINPEVVQCDYYDFLAGEPKAVKAFAGEFMSQYSWAEEAVDFLERKALGRK